MILAQVALPTVKEEMSEEPLPIDSSVTNNMDLNESQAQLETMLDASVSPPRKEDSEHEDAQKQKNSSSLPETQ